MNADLPPPLPDRDPPPLPAPRKKRRWPPALFLLITAALAAIYIGPLRMEVRFLDDAGRVPAPFQLTLRSATAEKEVLVKNGRLNLLRGRWQDLEITDLSYLRAIHPARGGTIAIERNTLLKLRQAATAGPSVPQRGDPPPARDDQGF